MAYGFTQMVENDVNDSASATVATPAFGISLTAGALLVACVWYTGHPTARTVALSGAGSPTWNEETTVSSGNEHLHAFYAMNIGGGVTTALTATFTGAGGNNAAFPAIICAEFSGFKTSAARLAFVGQHQASPGTGTDGVTSGLLGTLSEQPAGIISFSFNESSDATPAAGTSFTGLTASHDYGGTVSPSSRMEHRRVTATTSVAGTFTTTAGTSPHKTVAWAFSEAAGGGGGGGAFFVNQFFRAAIDAARKRAREWERNAGGVILVPAYPTLA